MNSIFQLVRHATPLLAIVAGLCALPARTLANNLPAGTGAAQYDPSNGHVLLEVNAVALWRLDSATGQFIGQPNDLDPTAGVRWTVPGTVRQADANTIGELALSNSIHFNNVFNGGTFQFDYAGVPGDLGQLLPAGLGSLAGLTLTYNTLGGQQSVVPVTFVPEPFGLSFLALGGVLLLARCPRA